MDIRVPYTAYLVALVAEASTAAGRLLDVPLDRIDALAQHARSQSAALSARLDASPLDEDTIALVDSGAWRPPGELATVQRAGGWASALRLDGMETMEVAAVEYANLLAAWDAETRLAQEFFDRPLQVLTELHGIICQGLVEPEVIGRYRTTVQAVHDGAQGWVIFNTADPESLPSLMTDLESWLRGSQREGSAAFPAPVAAAVVHEVLLQWQPFEAANGRLARAAARLVLRARGMDPFGLAVPEHEWAQDPGGYYNEVAATIRRRGDLGPWAERHTEALVAGLDAAVAAAHPDRLVTPHPRALQAAEAMAPGDTVTVAEYAERHGISRESAWRDLRTLVVCGELSREPKSLGRRFRRP